MKPLGGPEDFSFLGNTRQILSLYETEYCEASRKVESSCSVL